jgi:uncharacterized protein YhjY with autotransporter beta-barrel domain
MVRLVFPFFLAVIFTGIQGLIAGPGAAEVVQPIGNRIHTWTVDQANEIARLFDTSVVPGVTNPFGGDVAVSQIEPTRNLRFVRVVNSPSDMLGSWIMRASEVRGLTPQQIADKFALPNGTAPKYILIVDVPASPAAPNKYGLLTGIAGPIWSPGYYWGQGGGLQTRIVKGRTSGGGYDFTDYSRYIPINSYMHLQLIGERALLYAPRMDGNASRAGAYLDSFIPAAYTDLESVYDKLDFLNWTEFGPAPLAGALEQIGPERFDSLVHLGVRNSLLFGSALLDRGYALHRDRLNASSRDEQWSSLISLASAGGIGDLKGVPALQPSAAQEPGRSLWVRGLGEFGFQSTDKDRTGFDYRTGGFAAGIGFRPRPDCSIGFGAAYLGSDLDWAAGGGSADASSVKFGIYGSCLISQFFMDAAVSGGFNWIDASRRIVFSGVHRTAESDQTGHGVDVHLRGGGNFGLQGWQLTPMAGLSYFYLHQGPFAETGANSLNLYVDENTVHALRSILVLRLAKTLTTAGGVRLTPEAALGWAHEFPLDSRILTASLSEVPGAFSVKGFDGAFDSLLAGAGLTARLNGGFALFGRYDAEIREGFDAHLLSAGIRYVF